MENCREFFFLRGWVFVELNGKFVSVIFDDKVDVYEVVVVVGILGDGKGGYWSLGWECVEFGEC